VDESSPNSAWTSVARLLADKHGLDFYFALDRVIVPFLQHGNTRPLLDVLHSRREPGPRTALHVSGMIDKRIRATIPAVEAPHFEIRFVDNRGRGKPTESQIARAKAKRDLIEVGLRLLENRQEPSRLFWIGLFWITIRKALEPAPDFPLRAELARIGGGAGRPKDMEKEINGFLLSERVKERYAEEKCEVAVADVLEEIEIQAAEEGWTGQISARAIRRAYDDYARSKKQK
jgi:hypothetical protein